MILLKLSVCILIIFTVLTRWNVSRWKIFGYEWGDWHNCKCCWKSSGWFCSSLSRELNQNRFCNLSTTPKETSRLKSNHKYLDNEYSSVQLILAFKLSHHRSTCINFVSDKKVINIYVLKIELKDLLKLYRPPYPSV